MKIGITATSSADLPIETLKELDIDIIHFHIEKNGETFFDNDYSVKELFALSISFVTERIPSFSSIAACII